MTIDDKNTSKDGPVAVAVAVPSTQGQTTQTQKSADGIYVVSIPAGIANIGIDVTNPSMVISSIAVDSPLQNQQIQVGHYIHALIMPEVEIIYFKESKTLYELIDVNIGVERKLVVSPHTSYYDPSIGETNPGGVLYKHNLPIGQDLGIYMSGFPPVITQVNPTSPLAGRAHPGQTVVALLIPGQATMNLAAGAFTGVKVQERLSATSGMDGRKLVVKDGSKAYKEVGNNAAVNCEDCVIL